MSIANKAWASWLLTKVWNKFIQRIILALLAGAAALTACSQAPIATAPTALPAPTATAAPVVPTEPPVSGMETKLEQLETFFDNVYKAGIFTGAALIAQNGEIIFSRAWGLADREQEIPNTPQTIFRVGEMSMQFTAAAMLMLEQDGKLSLQDPICNYLDDCPEAWQAITIHHLLSHTSGIPDYLDPPRPGVNKITQEGATPSELVARFRDEPLAFEPGARRSWGRSGFVLAGLIIEHVSGQSYGDFLKEHIFEPLGMTHSGYGDPPEGLALGYQTANLETPVTFNASAMYAAGGCYSTAEDLFRWNEGLYNGQLLNETELQEMLTSHIITESGEGSGYGIVLNELNGRKGAGNGGGPDGYASVINRYFDDRITLVLIGNQNMNPFILRDQMSQIFFGTE